MATLGYWTEKKARLIKQGEISDGGATDVYAIYNSSTEERLDLSSVSGLPAIGSQHPTDNSLILARFTVAEHTPGKLFREISAIYETAGSGESSGTGEETTEYRLTALDFPTYTQSGDLVTDQVTGAPVINAAGEVFDTVPQVEKLLTGVHFIQRLKSAPLNILALSGTVNSGSITIYGITFKPRTARLNATARYLFDGSKYPYELDVTIEPRENVINAGSVDLLPAGISDDYTRDDEDIDIGWDVALLECGYQYRNASGALVRFTVTADDGSESAPQLPQLLTKDGGDYAASTSGVKAVLVVRTAKGDEWADLDYSITAP